MHPTFNYFAWNAIEANQTVAFVKYTIKKWAQTAVMEKQQDLLHLIQMRTLAIRVIQANVQVPPKKELDVKIKRPILMDDVIYMDKL